MLASLYQTFRLSIDFAMNHQATSDPVIALSDVTREFGAVKALRGVDLTVQPGEIVGLVGHNGAGKSTLMNIISGILSPSSGNYRVCGLHQGHPGATAPGDLGIGSVSQELLASPYLTVVENARVLHRKLTGFGWRHRAQELMAESLDAIFPSHGIRGDDLLEDLPIGKRQMTEIARALAADNLRLIILDEPTSSLDGQATEQLLKYVEKRRKDGLAVIFISHRLHEILDVSTRIVVMRDGLIVKDVANENLTRDDLVEAMGHVEAHAADLSSEAKAATDRQLGAVCINAEAKAPGAVPVTARMGEIIGLAGLAGRGQTRFLHQLADGKGIVRAEGSRPGVAFVAGDRTADGVFPVWSVGKNMTVRAMSAFTRLGVIESGKELEIARQWKKRIGVRAETLDVPLVTLSGGNQQKVLFARALASDARIILMDDPMRGVDVGTKMEVYRLIQEEARQGRCFIWYTTEFAELTYCDRVYVFRDGIASAEFRDEDIQEKNIVGASFAS